MNAETKTKETATGNDRWPPQIKYIVGNEACERFSYYGMRSILAGYITGEVARRGLGQSPDTATSVIHTFVFVNYFTPLFGAWLSTKLSAVTTRFFGCRFFIALGMGCWRAAIWQEVCMES